MLKKVIDPIVQRKDEQVIERQLPNKTEFVLGLRFSPIQELLYRVVFQFFFFFFSFSIFFFKLYNSILDIYC